MSHGVRTVSHAPARPACFGDVRSIDRSILKGVDAVVNLDSISNDPMDKRFMEATLAINYRCRTYTPR